MENDLRELFQSRFDAIDCRLDEHRELTSDRHKEVTGRLSTIEHEVREGSKLNVKHDEQLRTLFGRSRGEIGRLKLYAALFVAGGAALGWLLHVVGVIK